MSKSERSLLLALGLVLSITFLHHAWTSYRAGVAGDYYQFWVVGQALSSDAVDNPYTPEARKQMGHDFWQSAKASGDVELEKAARYRRDRLEPAGTPFLYAVFRAFSTGRYALDYEIFRVGSFVAYCLGIVAMCRVVGISLPFAALLILLTTEWFWPFRIEIAHANVNQLQVGALGGIVFARSRLSERSGAIVAGLLLGLLLCFKPNLLYGAVLLFGVWGLRREWGSLGRAVCGVVVGVAFAVLASTLLFGSVGAWGDWLSGSAEILQHPDYLRRSLPRLLGFAPPTSFSWLLAAALCAGVLAREIGRGAEDADRHVDELRMLAAGGAILVLTSPVVHVHYFVQCVPMLIVAFAAGPSRLPQALRISLAAIALLLIGGIFGAHFTLWPFLGAAILYGVSLAQPSAGTGATARGVALAAPLLLVFVASAPLPANAESVERVTLTPANAAEWAPGGKESDWIYGDIVLRNEHTVVVIARPVPGRNANWVLREVGCAVIDYARRADPRDALALFRPGGSGVVYRAAADQDLDLAGDRNNAFRCVADLQEGALRARLSYRLAGPFLEVETIYENVSDEIVHFEPTDQLRAEESFEKPGDESGKGRGRLFWAYDRHARQAYGVSGLGLRVRFESDWRNSTLVYEKNATDAVSLAPGERFELTRRLFVAEDLVALQAAVSRAKGIRLHELNLHVENPSGGVADADVVVTDESGQRLSTGRTGPAGLMTLPLKAGRYQLRVSAHGSVSEDVAFELPGDSALTVSLPAPAVLELDVIDAIGQRLPAKLQVVGVGDTPTPDFGPAQGEHALRNVYNTHDGRVHRLLAPGRYKLIVSRGPEYDAFQKVVNLRAGEVTRVEARLIRSLDTRGWVSADLHTHSTESGDTTSSPLGRVLNLLAEHIEFAPATEHNRISDYRPYLKALKAEAWMATSPGVEMTGDFPMNHQNAFPLVEQRRWQDGGAPLAADPVTQIRRLRIHDEESEKLVQQNHPDFFQILYDRDRDGTADGGYAPMLEEVDVLEVYPLAAFLNEEGRDKRNSRVLLWLQLLNRGVRIPAAINTDAHSNFHGVGARRTYIRSATDLPGAIDPLALARELKQGHAVMSTGPFLEVAMQAAGNVDSKIAIPGDDLVAPGGSAELTIRVQCPNWFDIDRVQVLKNGRFVPELNFTRRNSPKRFSSSTVQFAAVLPVKLERDAHIVVVAAGQKSKLGVVMGRRNAGIMPIAVSNPIFVDIDGNGFEPNYDRLDVELPTGAVWPEAEADPPAS